MGAFDWGGDAVVQTLSFSLIVSVAGSSCMAIVAFVGARWEVLSWGLTLLAAYLGGWWARRSVAGELV